MIYIIVYIIYILHPIYIYVYHSSLLFFSWILLEKLNNRLNTPAGQRSRNRE